jgi:hypothetical protein
MSELTPALPMGVVEILIDHGDSSRNMIVSVCRDASNSSTLQHYQPVPNHDETVVGIAMKTILLSVLYIRCIYIYEIWNMMSR